MIKEFVPYELAVKLKELGFDEPCFGWYTSDKSLIKDYVIKMNLKAPTFSQAFRWFREKYGIMCNITPAYNAEHWNLSWYGCTQDANKLRNQLYEETFAVDPYDWDLLTYEEAELECLTKLIEIVEQQNQK